MKNRHQEVDVKLIIDKFKLIDKIWQAHIDANHGFNSHPAEKNTSTPTTTTPTTITPTTQTSPRIVISKPKPEASTVMAESLTVTWMPNTQGTLERINIIFPTYMYWQKLKIK